MLTVLNLSATGTVLYNMKFQKENLEREFYEQGDKPVPPDVGPGRFLREKLNLSQEQHEQFRELRRNFHVRANELTYEMQIKRNEMITELAKENPDLQILKQIARDIGDMHTELKELTMDYYLGMKEVCTPEQEEQLFRIFEVLINRDNTLPMPGRGRGRGRGPNPYF